VRSWIIHPSYQPLSLLMTNNGAMSVKTSDTVGELKSAKICVSHVPSWKAKKLGKLPQEKVLSEL
jgi:hypothetical protein